MLISLLFTFSASATPLILVPPLDLSLGLGNNALFTVVAAGLPPVSYEWYHGTNKIPGQTGASLSLLNVTPLQAGRYTVVVKDLSGEKTAASATLDVGQLLAPLLVTDLLDTIVEAGDPLELEAKVESSDPVSYQWYFNGAPLANETNRILDFYYTRLSDAGAYQFVASNLHGAVTSSVAMLDVVLSVLPFGDNFGQGGTLKGVYYAGIGSIVDATREPLEPRHDDKRTERTMWLSWLAPSNGIARLQTIGSDFDTVLAVYTGSRLDELIPVESDDDSGPANTSAVRFNAKAGVTYRIAIAGHGIEAGQAVLELDLLETANLLPWFVRQPRSMAVLPGSSVELATAFTNPLQTSAQLQWQFRSLPTSSTSPTVIIPSVSEEFVGSYRARVAAGEHVVYSREAEIQINSRGFTNVLAREKLVDAGDAGQYMHLALASEQPRIAKSSRTKSGGTGTRGFSTTQIFSTAGARSDPGEPVHCGIGAGRSKWFVYQAETNATIKIDTDGSDFDTVLAVYVGPGNSYSTLTNIACDNDSGLDGKDSMVRFEATQGTIYYIAVDGVSTSTPKTGTVKLHINLGSPVSIAAGPQSTSATNGSAASFSVAADGMTNYVYQWRFNGTSLTGATNATLVRTNVAVGQDGSYDVVVGNPINAVTSQVAMLTIISSSITISSQPQDQSVTAGQSVAFNVADIGNGSLRYQWRRNGSAMPDRTNATMLLNPVQASDEGNYDVVVTDANGVRQSAAATLTVMEAPLITAQPLSQTAAPGSSVTLISSATGDPSPALQWFRNGVAIAGATSSSLVLNNLGTENEGSYTMVASNPAGSASSQPADLYLNSVLRLTNVNHSSQLSTLRVIGRAGTNYLLQASSDFQTWTNLAVHAPASGIWNFTDPNTNATIRFYRVVQP